MNQAHFTANMLEGVKNIIDPANPYSQYVDWDSIVTAYTPVYTSLKTEIGTLYNALD